MDGMLSTKTPKRLALELSELIRLGNANIPRLRGGSPAGWLCEARLRSFRLVAQWSTIGRVIFDGLLKVLKCMIQALIRMMLLLMDHIIDDLGQ